MVNYLSRVEAQKFRACSSSSLILHFLSNGFLLKGRKSAEDVSEDEEQEAEGKSRWTCQKKSQHDGKRQEGDARVLPRAHLRWTIL